MRQKFELTYSQSPVLGIKPSSLQCSFDSRIRFVQTTESLSSESLKFASVAGRSDSRALLIIPVMYINSQCRRHSEGVVFFSFEDISSLKVLTQTYNIPTNFQGRMIQRIPKIIIPFLTSKLLPPHVPSTSRKYNFRDRVVPSAHTMIPLVLGRLCT